MINCQIPASVEKSADHLMFLYIIDSDYTVYVFTQVITHKTLKESYKTIPRSEILFGHDDGRNRDFHCTLELTADNTTTKLSAVASIKDVSFTLV